MKEKTMLQGCPAGDSGETGLTPTADLEQVFNKRSERIYDDWKRLLKFQSISSLPDFDEECVACAHWLRLHLEDMLLEAQLIETPGKPLVYAKRQGDPDKPTILYYGHYDVQPVEPLEGWRTSPFNPVIRNGRMRARGARDNKGHFFSFLKGLQYIIEQERLGCTIKVLLEGEEENISGGLRHSLSTVAEELKADVLLAYETAGFENGDPAIMAGMRGVAILKLRLHGANRELHSGHHGGLIKNAAAEMARLLSELHQPDGLVAVPGFYDAVREPTPEQRELAALADFDEQRYLSELDSDGLAGEAAYTPIERVAFRPTMEINGFHSGYTGKGIRSSIPNQADAMISMRLVPEQDAQTCLEQTVAFFKQRLQRGIALEVTKWDAVGGIIECDISSPYHACAVEALQGLRSKERTFAWSGASLPIIPAVCEQTGAVPLLVGFGVNADQEHAPNESFALSQFQKGFVFTCRLLERLSR